MEPTILLALLGWLLTSVVTRLRAEVRQAPLAVEDENGFHLVSEDADAA